VARVDGVGSVWTSADGIYISGYQTNVLGRTGDLIITGGGAVRATGVVGQWGSHLAIDVGRGSSLVVGGGTGTIANVDEVRVLAGAGVAAGATFTPVSSGVWSGTGAYQGVGGTLNTGSHQFTVSDVQAGTSGGSVTIDLSQKQRILVSDGPGGWVLGGSFLMKTSPSWLTFTATKITDGPLTTLSGLLDPGDGVLGGWALAATGGYAAGDPAYLSFGVGSAQSLDDLLVWQYAGGSWTKYDAIDLTYDQTYASFTVSAMGMYAVTGLAVPEPAGVVLIGVATVGLVVCTWRRRRRRP
jgi:hypothetical protein